MAGLVAFALGAPGPDALRLGLAMTLLQGAIGSLNDLVDARADAAAKPWKPIPAGLVGEGTARGLALGLVAAGLLLAAPSGPGVLATAVAGVATGLLYDLRFKGTAASWVPFAMGIPLLPLYGALGAAAAGAVVPVSVAILCGLAIPAGAGLAIANAVADASADAASGTRSVASALGRGTAWTLGAVLVGGTALVALMGALGADRTVARVALLGLDDLLAVAGAAVVAMGLALGRSGDAGRAVGGWELQGVGLGLLAVAWVLVLPVG